MERNAPTDTRGRIDGPEARRRIRRRRVFAAVSTTMATLAIAGGLAGWWYLDRFVIRHVEIADVSAYAATVTTSAPEPVATTGDGEDASGDDAPEATATGFASSGTTITIEQVAVGGGDQRITYFVADIELDDPTDLRAAFADDAFGTNITEDTSDIAASVDAVLAINGDYYGFRESGIVIRNGVAYRDDGVRSGLALYVDGTMDVYDETVTTAAELLAADVWNTWSFGPALLNEGEVVEGIDTVEVDRYIGKRSMQGSQPRTAVGMIEPGHYVFVVVDGRAEGYSRGMTLPELADVLQRLGCTVAYNLDGGGSATMYFNGELVNNPVGRGTERGTSDILYIGT